MKSKWHIVLPFCPWLIGWLHSTRRWNTCQNTEQCLIPINHRLRRSSGHLSESNQIVLKTRKEHYATSLNSYQATTSHRFSPRRRPQNGELVISHVWRRASCLEATEIWISLLNGNVGRMWGSVFYCEYITNFCYLRIHIFRPEHPWQLRCASWDIARCSKREIMNCFGALRCMKLGYGSYYVLLILSNVNVSIIEPKLRREEYLLRIGSWHGFGA